MCSQEIGSRDELDIETVMTPWVYSMGYPVLEVQRLVTGDIGIRQKRFLIDPTMDPWSPPSESGSELVAL